MNNIHVIIGDNGIGKTRFLVKKINESVKNGLGVVTNIERYNSYNSKRIDKVKVNAIDDIGNRLLNKFRDEESEFMPESFELLRLVTMKGDVLILDEIDALIPDEDLLNLMAAIADCREHWKEIYISSYCAYIDRVFIDTNRDDYRTTYNPNYYTLEKNGIKHMTEDEAYEYLNSV